MSGDSPAPISDAPPTVAPLGIPGTLRTTAGITWRVLVVVAGLVFVGYVLNIIFPVVFALFFALLMTAWAQPLMNLLHRKLPKVLSMVLALLVIGALVLVILGAVVRSTVSEGPKLVASRRGRSG